MTHDTSDVEFDAEGVTLRGTSFRPAEAGGPRPCVVMAHGCGRRSHPFHRRLRERVRGGGHLRVGHTTIAVGGTPTWRRVSHATKERTLGTDPRLPTRDQLRPEPAGRRSRPDRRVGLQFLGRPRFRGGRHRPARVRPSSVRRRSSVGSAEFQGLIRLDMEDGNHAAFEADRRARARGEAPCSFPSSHRIRWPSRGCRWPMRTSTSTGREASSSAIRAFPNEITLRSVEHLYGYEPGWYLPRITPTPLLMVVALKDRVTAERFVSAGVRVCGATEEARHHPGWALRHVFRPGRRHCAAGGSRLVRRAPDLTGRAAESRRYLSAARFGAMTVWINRRDETDVAADLAESARSGGALAGVRLAVKDNVDVAGLPTTAACPEFAYRPDRDAALGGGTARGGRRRPRKDESRPVRHRARRHAVATRRRARQPPPRPHQRRLEFGLGRGRRHRRGRHRDRHRHRRIGAHPRRPAGHRRHQADRGRGQHRRRGARMRVLRLRHDLRPGSGARQPRDGRDGRRCAAAPVAGRREACRAAQSRRRGARRAARARRRVAGRLRRRGRGADRRRGPHRHRRPCPLPCRGQAVVRRRPGQRKVRGRRRIHRWPPRCRDRSDGGPHHRRGARHPRAPAGPRPARGAAASRARPWHRSTAPTR